jgi:periplasmic divalent cation tolerance protein
MKSLLIMTACPSEEVAIDLARRLVQERCAACVNIVPAIHSIYRWHDAIEETREVLLLIKSTEENYPALESIIHSVHPYQVPEVLAIPIEKAAPHYMAWLTEACG